MRLARGELTKQLVARADCERVRELGLPIWTEDRIHGNCVARLSTTASDANLYNDVSSESYRRLLDLGLKYDFSVVAVQYPGRPVDELRATLPSDVDIPVVDNHASFVVAVEEHTRLGVYEKNVGFHLTTLGDRILAENIFEVLLAEGLLPANFDTLDR